MSMDDSFSLWDRLVFDGQDGDLHAMGQVNMDQVVQSVVADLVALLNEVCPTEMFNSPKTYIAESVLAYGLPPVTGRATSKVYTDQIATWIHQTIQRFEPRISPMSLTVETLGGDSAQKNHLIAYEIKGTIVCEPHSVELALQARMDLDSGRFISTQF